MRNFVIGLCLFSSSAFANPGVLLSNGLSSGAQFEVLADIPVAGGVFNVVDAGNSWRRNDKPGSDQSYCAFFSNDLVERPKVARAGEVYHVTSIYPLMMAGGVGTKIELAKADTSSPFALTSIICSHAHIEGGRNTTRVRSVLRYEMFLDEFVSLLNGYLAVRAH